MFRESLIDTDAAKGPVDASDNPTSNSREIGIPSVWHRLSSSDPPCTTPFFEAVFAGRIG